MVDRGVKKSCLTAKSNNGEENIQPQTLSQTAFSSSVLMATLLKNRHINPKVFVWRSGEPPMMSSAHLNKEFKQRISPAPTRNMSSCNNAGSTANSSPTKVLKPKWERRPPPLSLGDYKENGSTKVCAGIRARATHDVQRTSVSLRDVDATWNYQRLQHTTTMKYGVPRM